MPSSLRRQAALIRSAAGFRLLFFATVGSSVGTWMATIALTVDIKDRTGSAWWVSAIFIVTLLPSVVVGLAAGPLLDRMSRKGLLIGSDVLRLAVFAGLPFVHSATGIVVLAGVAGIANSFFRPVVLAGLPNLLGEENLALGTSLLQSADWLATAAGPVAAGAIVGASGPHVVYWINAATFLFSALLISRIPARNLQSDATISRGHWRDLREGVAEYARSRPLLTVLIGLSFANIAMGLINVAEIFLATRSLHSGAFGYGLLWTATGVGLVIGSLAVGSLIDRRPPLTVYPWLYLPWAIGTLAAGISPSIWVAALAMVLSGLGNGLTVPVSVVLIQQSAADRIRGRVFTVIISFNNALLGVAFVLSGGLTKDFGARWVYGGAAAVLLVGAATVAVLATRVSPRGEPARVDA